MRSNSPTRQLARRHVIAVVAALLLPATALASSVTTHPSNQHGSAVTADLGWDATHHPGTGSEK